MLPEYVQREFEDYLRCGRLEQGFLRVCCDNCHAEHLVAFICKRRGFCPSCGARRIAESAALLVDEVFPEQPVRQWVLSFPYPLRFLFAARPDVMGQVLGIVGDCCAFDQEGRDAVGLRVGRVRKAAVAREDFSRVGTEVSRISGWRQYARTLSSLGLAVDHGRKGRLFFLYLICPLILMSPFLI